MLRAVLKERAIELVQPPTSFQLVIEEYGEDEVMFSWSNEEQDEGIEDTVKAVISKKTGKIQSFIWFKDRNGNFQLSRKECYQKALELLHMIVPGYYQYLKLIVQENEDEDDDTSMKESFTFHMHNGHNVPIHLELVMVVVNRKTGQIDHYSGPRFDMVELSESASKPAISKK